MTTKFIGIKEFRQNIADYAARARTGDVRFVVMNRTKPLFEIKPFADDVYLDDFIADVKQAEADVAAGRVYTQEQVRKELGLTWVTQNTVCYTRQLL